MLLGRPKIYNEPRHLLSVSLPDSRFNKLKKMSKLQDRSMADILIELIDKHINNNNID